MWNKCLLSKRLCYIHTSDGHIRAGVIEISALFIEFLKVLNQTGLKHGV